MRHPPPLGPVQCGLSSSSAADVTADGCAALAESLGFNTTLLDLDIRVNEAGAEGAEALAESLKTNCSLKSLDIRSNKIGPKGCAALADSLALNGCLTSLSIQDNDIGVEGCTALAKGLGVIVCGGLCGACEEPGVRGGGAKPEPPPPALFPLPTFPLPPFLLHLFENCTVARQRTRGHMQAHALPRRVAFRRMYFRKLRRMQFLSPGSPAPKLGI